MLRKLTLFRNSTLTVLVSVMCPLLMTTPVAYGEEAFALEVN
jgi:hypothetical protein